jgi:large subunit ribosomal protein L15
MSTDVIPGRQILALEATKSILTSKIVEQANEVDEFDREPFQHPVLADVDKLSYRQPQQIIQIEKLARLGLDVGLGEVMRWKPRMVSVLAGPSGDTHILNFPL